MTILIISVLGDFHAAAVAWGLRKLNSDAVIWNWSDFPFGSEGTLSLPAGSNGKVTINLGDATHHSPFDVVWYRRIGIPTPKNDSHPADVAFIRRESGAFLSNTVDFVGNSKTTWVNHPDAARRVNRKALQLNVARDLGFSIPATLITNNHRSVLEFFKQHGGEVIYKAFTPATWMSADDAGARMATVYATKLLYKDIAESPTIEACPGIYQSLIKPQYELRITVIGSMVMAASIDSQQFGETVDWRPGLNYRGLPLRRVQLPTGVLERCLALCRRFELLFAAIDMIVDAEGNYIFIEINEAGQFLFKEHLDPSLTLLDSFCRFLADPHLQDPAISGGAHVPLRLSEFCMSEEAKDAEAEDVQYQARSSSNGGLPLYRE